MDCEKLPPHLAELCCGDDPKWDERTCDGHFAAWQSLKRQNPTILQKAASFVSAFAKHVMGGMRKCSEEEQDARRDVCLACDRYDSLRSRCRECGCRLKTKIPWANSACPLGKWGNS